MVGRRSRNHSGRGGRRKELEERETGCGWTSLDRLSQINLGGLPSGYGPSLSMAGVEAGKGHV